MRVSFEAGVTAYLLIGIITFGHGAANAPQTRTNIFNGKEFATDTEFHATNGFVAGVFWPCYWSWTAFDWIGGRP